MGPLTARVKVLIAYDDANLSINGCPPWTTVPIQIPATWPGDGSAANSDQYFVQVASEDDSAAFTQVPFILRSAKPNRARLAVVLPEYTYQAYNVWGGISIYTTNPSAPDPHTPAFLQRCVSFNRPYIGPSFLASGTNRFSQQAFFLRHFCSGAWGLGKWEVDWYLSSDLEEEPGVLSHYNCFVSFWHDEYWTARIWNAYHDAIYRAGVNGVFLGGNTGFWKANWTSATRQLSVFKVWAPDYASRFGQAWPPRDFTTTVSSPKYDRTGYWWNGLMPVSSPYSPGRWIGPSPMCGAGGLRQTVLANYQVNAQDHWTYDGTGMRDHEPFPTKRGASILGWESDAVNFTIDAGGQAIPTSGPHNVTDGAGDYSSNLTILAYCNNMTADNGWACSYVGTADKSPTEAPASQAQATVSILEPAKGPGHVFAVGTNDWSNLGLYPGYKSTFASSVGRMTANVFNRFLASKGTGSSAARELTRARY